MLFYLQVASTFFGHFRLVGAVAFSRVLGLIVLPGPQKTLH